MRTIEEMVAAGKAKLTRKAERMVTSWNGAKARMKTGYGLTPFGPTRKANYNAGIDAASHRVDVEKWGTNWAGKMKE